MFVKVSYLGFYPLGSDIEINNIKIMQLDWNEYKKPVLIYGKKNVINPFYSQLFYVISKTNIAFFTAYEYGLGHYHVFSVSDKSSDKLSKRIDFTPYTDFNDEKQLFDKLDLMINNYQKNKKTAKTLGGWESPFWEIHKYICDLEQQGKIATDNPKSISYLKEILINDGPEYALVINFHSKAFPKRKYKVGVCVRGEPLIWIV